MLLLLATCTVAEAQQGDWQQFLAELYENDEEAVLSMEDAYEHLTELAGQPLDINTVEQEDLLQIPGLNPEQINDILEYRHRYGRLRSMEELAMIESIGPRMRLYLSNFLTVEDPYSQPWYKGKRLKESLHHLQHQIALTMQTPTYYRAGDMRAPVRTWLGDNKYAGKYLGDPVKHSVRYSVSMDKHVVLNLTGSKTAGEPFGGEHNRYGYDSYAYNLSIRQLGVFRQIIVGQFRGQFGMGLTLNNNFTIGKQGMLSSMGRRLSVFTPHSSTSDSKHFQGLATTVALTRRMALAAFLSYRKIDATLNKDSTISTILTSGYHRTLTEMNKKNNAAQMTTGVHIGYEHPSWGAGVSAVYTWLNRNINPTYSKNNVVSKGKMYRLYYPRGNRFWNIGIDYHYRWRELSLSGETATDNELNIATVNSATWRSPWRITFMALQRYYSYKYNALYGSSFGESSVVKNESGLYIGAQWAARHNLTLDIYSDIAYFPWLKYRVSNSSYSWDNSLTGTLSKEKWIFSLRYRIKMRQGDMTVNSQKRLITKTDQHLRFLAVLNGDRWSTRTHMEACALSFDNKSKGFILAQSVGYQFSVISSDKTVRQNFREKDKDTGKLQLYALAAWFNTDDYDSRLYTYERGMRYSFGSTSYYGKGIHAAFMTKYVLANWCTALCKIAHTRYFDRSVIGTAERMIFSPYCTDIDLQLLFKL